MDPAQLPDRFILLFFRKSHNDQVPTENTVQYDMVSYGEYALITIAASRFEKDHVIQCSATRKRSMFIRIITECTATARPFGRDMGCNLWFDTWYISCFSQTQCCVKYLVIMDRIKTALDCIKFYESNEARLAYLLGYMQNHIDACYYLIGIVCINMTLTWFVEKTTNKQTKQTNKRVSSDGILMKTLQYGMLLIFYTHGILCVINLVSSELLTLSLGLITI